MGSRPDKLTRAGILSRVTIDQNGCWIWRGKRRTKGGYATYQNTTAHRFVYKQLVGDVRADWDVDHLCRVRDCVNPEHLEAVTRRENLMRGNTRTAQRAAQTHCVHGHEFTPQNTYIKRNGCRACRKCHSRAVIQSKQRKRAKEPG
jgi:hypothetical protein